MMESIPRMVVLAVLSTLAIIVRLVQAQDPQGFISLDCGLPENEPSPYKVKNRGGLWFSSDKGYIKSGKNGRVQERYEYSELYLTMRYFPDGIRNCYDLSVDKGRQYLIRAFFVYGNYDGLNKKPVFDLYLGPNLWNTIDLEMEVNGTREEILHIPASRSLQICLVKTGPTTPLISSLELRPMETKLYRPVSGSLRLFYRQYHSKSKSTIMYSEDVYDRFWNPNFFWTEWTQISTSLEVKNNDYLLPEDALKTAVKPINASQTVWITWISDNPDEQFYTYAHFAELEDLKENETRAFNIYWNGVQDYGPVIPKRLQVNTIETTSPKKCTEGKCNFQLIRTNGSTLPPLINALEIYTVVQFPQFETDESDVGAMKNIAATYALNRINWQGDPCVPHLFRWDGLNCSNTSVSMPPRITTLNLSSSGLTGTIAAAFQNLTQLERLDLSNNNLTGEVPEFLGKMKSLVFINISKNDLKGSIPQALQRKGMDLHYQGNPRLCISGPCLPSKDTKGKPFPVVIVASVASAAVIIAVLVLIFVFRKKKPSTVKAPQQPPPSVSTATNFTYANSPEPSIDSIQTNKRRFTYSEVINMTNNFHRVVGQGGFGMVYHGTLNGVEQVAVKVLSQSSSQGYRQFKAEVDLLMRVHHTHLVSLVGYCDENDHLAVIYEFVPNGDLRQHLSGKSNINWGIRLQITVEAALGLEYLHSGCIPPMVHRDVKTTNILLDEQFKAKLADFGLSRSFPVGGESHVSTVIAGTPGYLDPEYYHTSRLTEKSDVYSFGIVLLEMITNEPVIDHTRSKTHITQWVGFELNRGDISRIMDPRLHGDYDTRSAWRALELAMSCANPSSTRRPSMSQVVVELKECLMTERSRTSMSRGMESQSSAEVSMIVDTRMFPMAR